MFMPGYKSTKDDSVHFQDYDWEAEQKKFNLMAKRPQTAEERDRQAFMTQCYNDRAKRMDEARARGATREELISIMEG